MKKQNLIIILLIAIVFQFSCATGPSLGQTGTATASVATGAVDVGVDQSFTVTFSAAVKTSTVTTSSFYVVPTEDEAESTLVKYTAYDSGVCNVASVINGSVSCTSATECVFTPASELGEQTEYAICLTSAIQFLDADTYGYFEGLTETFTTEAEGNGDCDDDDGDGDGDGEGEDEAEVDVTAPTVSMTSAESTLTASSPFSVTITFSEEVSGFDLTDITVTNGTASNLQETTENKIYTVSVTPSGDPVTVTMSVGAGKVVDASDNENTVSNTFSIIYDTSALTVTVTSDVDDPTNDSPFEVTITFSEEVTGFTLADITVTNGTAGNLNSAANPVFTADITPTAAGEVSVDVNASVATDATSGKKANTAAVTFDTVYDNVTPTVSSTTPADEDDSIGVDTTIAVTFGEAMDPTTITTNTADTSCSGSLQVSDDNFVTCVQMAAAPVASGGDKTFTVTPNANLEKETVHKIKITTGVKDVAGNAMAATYTTATGFETSFYIYFFDVGFQHTGNLGNRAATTTECSDRKDAEYADLPCDNIVALLAYTGDDIADLLDNHGFNDGIVMSPTEVKIGDDWADLLDNSFDTDFVTAGASSFTTIWTGTNSDGILDAANNCNNWTVGVIGTSGRHVNVGEFGNGFNAGWMNCGGNLSYMCVCQ